MSERLGMKKMSVVMLCALGLMAAAIAGLILLSVFRPRPAPPPAGERRVAVRILEVRPRVVERSISLPARIAPFAEADLAPDKAGTVVELLADKGDRVSAGQVLMRLDARLWEAARARAEAVFDEAERDLRRLTELARTGAVAQSDLDAARTRRDLAEVGAREARVHVSQCELRSPIAGRVDDRRIEIGERAAEGEAVFRVIADDRVKVRVDVPERVVAGVARGRPADMRVQAYPESAFTGTVAFVAAEGDPLSNTYRAEIVADNPDGRLRPGMIAEVTLPVAGAREVLCVPLAAVLARKGQHLAFVEAGGRASGRVLRVASFGPDEAVIAAGLQPGDRVIVEGQRLLSDGAAVQVVAPEEPPRSGGRPAE